MTDAIGSCDSCHILSGSLDRSIIYWDVTTAQPLRRLRCHAGGISCIAFSEDSNVAVSGTYIIKNFTSAIEFREINI